MASNKLQIFYIFADNCEHCKETLGAIEEILAKNKIPHEILKFPYNTDVAINIAIKNNIDDLPGIVIGSGEVFKGKNIPKDKLEKSIKKANKK